MGYMGFGLQKWIYTMRPRKPYSIQRKGSFTEIPSYKIKFKLQPSKDIRPYNFGILLVLLLVLVVGFSVPKWLSQAKAHQKKVTALKTYKANKAFDFLMTSGKRRLKVGNLSGAFSEFKLAKAIQPNHPELKQLYFETLRKLCIQNEVNCTPFDSISQPIF